MASASDSTPAPSRRAFLSHAVASGVAATRPAIFVAPPLVDAALLAMEGGILALVARCDHILADPNLGDDDIAFHTADSALLDETRRLAELPARTLEGLIFKARWVEHGDDDLRDSIVADLLAMA